MTVAIGGGPRCGPPGRRGPAILAAVIALELWHALRAQPGFDRQRDCYANEVDAMQAQAHVWSLSWPDGELPAGTRLKAVLTEIATVAATGEEAGLDDYVGHEPGYRRVCGGRPPGA